ncbi:MAG TPA: hypothetical protein VF796_13470, partial [Humisphaera sp.]
KMTLYKHFRSKEELIIAALRKRGDAFLGWFDGEVRRRAGEPRARLLAVFDVVGAWVGGGGPYAEAGDRFCGCAFGNAAAEYHDPAHPVHAVAAEYKRKVLAYVTALARDAGAASPDALASGLCLLLEGAVVLAHAAGVADAPARAKSAAAILVDAGLPPIA